MSTRKLLVQFHIRRVMGGLELLDCYDDQGAVVLVLHGIGGGLYALSNLQPKGPPPTFWDREDPNKTVEELDLWLQQCCISEIDSLRRHPDLYDLMQSKLEKELQS